MSRSRSNSRAAEPLALKFMHLAQPSLYGSYDVDKPELPPLPQPHLVLPKGSHPVYVGEDFQCLVAVQLLPDSLEAFADESAMHLRVETQAPDGSRAELVNKSISISRDQPWAVENAAVDVRVPGPWLLLASVKYGSDKVVRRSLKVEASPAISVRTKVSRGSSALDAHVVEAQVENMSDSTLLVESLALNPSNGWDAVAPSSITTDQETTGGSIVLRPRDVHQWSFILRGGWAPEAGPLAIAWRREPLGARGWQTTGSIRV